MTKAKTASKKAADAKKNNNAQAKKDAKPKAAKTAAPVKKASTKPAKSSTKESRPAVPKKSAPKSASKAAGKAAPAKAGAAKTKPAAAKPSVKTDAAAAKAAPMAIASFASTGLGVKVSSKKPGLTVAPGVMILGRPAQTKVEQTPRPSDRRLSQKEMEEIKNILQERRERLLAGMRRELAMQKERAESKVADEVDKATDAYDEDLSFEIAVANDQELEEIQVALEKIEKGTYGECEICGCSISPSRLKILPSATTCVSCRGQEELSRRRDDGAPLFSMLGEDGDAESDAL